MTTQSTRLNRCGVGSLKTPQGDTAPGSEPRQSPPQATGGPSFTPNQAKRRRRLIQKHSKQGRKMKHQLFKLMQWNAEGVSNKKTELEHLLHEQDINVCCIQETHLQPARSFKVRGYQCFRCDRPGRRKGGILTLVRNNINAIQITSHMEDSELQVLKLRKNDLSITLVNVYSPSDKALSLDKIPAEEPNLLVMGDFNSHSQSWGYDHLDRRGEEVENWQDDNQLNLINNPDDPPTFYSRCWHSTTTPDLAFCSDNIHKIIKRSVGEQLGGSDHRPVHLALNRKTCAPSTVPRWNYKKANWDLFRHVTNDLCHEIRVEGRDINQVVKDLNNAILQAAHKSIPRGARKNYKPYWSEELEELQGQLSEARRQAEESPSQENNTELQHAKAKFLRHKQQATRKSWKKKTSFLNLERDSQKLWRLVKQLNDEDGGRGSTTLEENGDLLTDKQAANKFAQNYEDISNIQVNRERKREVRREQRERKTNQVASGHMNKDLTLNELQATLRQLKTRKSPGPDGISNEMLQHLGNKAMSKLLEVYNHSWKSGLLPQIWREAIMSPILKKGKNPKLAGSYRPISLTSCVGKTMERIVNERLKWYLETNNLLATQQSGFRQFRSTEDQTTYLSQEIEDAFQEQKVILTVWIDLQRAFDKVWTDGLLVKLMRSGVGGHMLKWITSYLHNRRARVSLDQVKSRKFLLRNGVPQGGVLSPTLFLLFINDLVDELPRGVKAALYADDLVLWCKEEYATTATIRMQEVLNRLSAWAEDWQVTINKEKSSTTLFTLSPKQKASTLKLGLIPLKEENMATYLGVTFDKRQTWKPHLAQAEGKARKKLSIMRKLAGTTWGADEQILKTIYQGTVRPHLEYGSSAWSHASKTNLINLDRVQNQALRIITGGMRSTPIQAMENITGIQSLHTRRDTKLLLQAHKYECITGHPMKERLQGLTKNRLKRSSFIHRVKMLKRNNAETLNLPSLPISVAETSDPCDDETNLSVVPIHTTIPSLDQRPEEDENFRRHQTQMMIQERYPSEAWIHIYTDGSATEAVKNGGAGIFIQYPDGRSDRASVATGKHCSNYKAETEALMSAITMVRDSVQKNSQVVLLTDAKSVLQALINNKLPQLAKALNQLSSNCLRVALQWIPAHCGIPGNEQADRLAKEGSRQEQISASISYEEKVSIIRSLKRTRQPKDAYHQLSRPEQVVLMRLRTGHNRLNAHMYRKMKLVQSPMCPCGEEEQTTEHVLQCCKRHHQERKATWPSETSLHQKLYGTIQDLRQTTDFISATGLTV